MNRRYKSWCLSFTDIDELNTGQTDERGRGQVEKRLCVMFGRLNSTYGDECGLFDRESMFLIRNGEDYRYILFFKLKDGI